MRQTDSDNKEDKQEAEENKKVYSIIRNWINRKVSGKVIIYIELINQVK